jgi:hypothetical protein
MAVRGYWRVRCKQGDDDEVAMAEKSAFDVLDAAEGPLSSVDIWNVAMNSGATEAGMPSVEVLADQIGLGSARWRMGALGRRTTDLGHHSRHKTVKRSRSPAEKN